MTLSASVCSAWRLPQRSGNRFACARSVRSPSRSLHVRLTVRGGARCVGVTQASQRPLLQSAYRFARRPCFAPPCWRPGGHPPAAGQSGFGTRDPAVQQLQTLDRPKRLKCARQSELAWVALARPLFIASAHTARQPRLLPRQLGNTRPTKRWLFQRWLRPGDCYCFPCCAWGLAFLARRSKVPGYSNSDFH